MGGEEILTKMGINVLILAVLCAPIGYLSRKQRVKPAHIGVVGTLAGAAIGLVLSSPDFDPIGATVFATLALAAVAGGSSYGLMRVVDRMRESIEHSPER